MSLITTPFRREYSKIVLQKRAQRENIKTRRSIEQKSVLFYLDRAQNARIKATNWVMVVTREKKKEFEIRNEYAVVVK